MLIANNINKKNKNKKSKKLKDEVSTIGFKEKLDPKKVRKMKLSSQNWLRRQLNDVYVKAAKKEGYYSRSAYKLQELNHKFHFLKTGMKVIDLGAAPGGWSQVVAQYIFKKYKNSSNRNTLLQNQCQVEEYTLSTEANKNKALSDIQNTDIEDTNIGDLSTNGSSVYNSSTQSNTTKSNTTIVGLSNQNIGNNPKTSSVETSILEKKVSENSLSAPNSIYLSNILAQDSNTQDTCITRLDIKTEASPVLIDKDKYLNNIKEGSLLISLDLLPINFIENAITLQGDFTDTNVMNHIREILSGKKVDVVLSDMAPNTLGIQAVDHLRIMNLVEMAYDFALEILEKNGTFVAKVFQGGTTGELLNRVKRDFREINHYKPEATRKESNEIYLIARKYKGKPKNYR